MTSNVRIDPLNIYIYIYIYIKFCRWASVLRFYNRKMNSSFWGFIFFKSPFLKRSKRLSALRSVIISIPSFRNSVSSFASYEINYDIIPENRLKVYIYIYIYIYVCVCVCVRVCVCVCINIYIYIYIYIYIFTNPISTSIHGIGKNKKDLVRNRR